MGEYILKTEHSNGTNVHKNFMDKYPSLNLRPSGLLPVVNEGIKDIKSSNKKIIRTACLSCGIVSICVGVISLIAEDCDIETFLIFAGVAFGISCYISLIVVAGCISHKQSLIRTSELSKSTEYYQLPSGKKAKDSCIMDNAQTPFFIVIKDSKFGVWNFHMAKYVISPEYDYLEWREKNKLLYAEVKGESFVMDIQGTRLS